MVKKKKQKIDNKPYKVSKNPQSQKGVLSCVTLLINLVIIAALLVFVTLIKGKAGEYIGAAGIVSFLLSITGFIQGMRGLYEKDMRYQLAYIGLLFNGGLMLGWLYIMSIGLYG